MSLRHVLDLPGRQVSLDRSYDTDEVTITVLSVDPEGLQSATATFPVVDLRSLVRAAGL